MRLTRDLVLGAFGCLLAIGASAPAQAQGRPTPAPFGASGLASPTAPAPQVSAVLVFVQGLSAPDERALREGFAEDLGIAAVELTDARAAGAASSIAVALSARGVVLRVQPEGRDSISMTLPPSYLGRAPVTAVVRAVAGVWPGVERSAVRPPRGGRALALAMASLPTCRPCDCPDDRGVTADGSSIAPMAVGGRRRGQYDSEVLDPWVQFQDGVHRSPLAAQELTDPWEYRTP